MRGESTGLRVWVRGFLRQVHGVLCGVARIGQEHQDGGGGPGVRIKDQGSGFRVQGSGFRVQGSGIRVQGAGFRVQGSDRAKP